MGEDGEGVDLALSDRRKVQYSELVILPGEWVCATGVFSRATEPTEGSGAAPGRPCLELAAPGEGVATQLKTQLGCLGRADWARCGGRAMLSDVERSSRGRGSLPRIVLQMDLGPGALARLPTLRRGASGRGLEEVEVGQGVAAFFYAPSGVAREALVADGLPGVVTGVPVGAPLGRGAATV